MAVSVVPALLRVQAQSAWNRLRHESGLAGPIVTAATLGFVALILAVPSLLMLDIGRDLGEELRASPDATSLLHWNGLQAVFTVVFAMLGGIRHKPSFTFQDVGTHPISPLQLLVAEVPASLIEVFPLLGAAGIVSLNLGLAWRLPVLSPLIALLALQGIVAMLGLLILTGSIKRYLAKRPYATLAAGAIALGAVAHGGLEGFRSFVRSAIPDVIPFLPGSRGYGGLVELRSGSVSQGAIGIVVALTATSALLALAASVYSRELATEGTSLRLREGASRTFRFRRNASGIGRLFQKQLLDSKMGRLNLIIPLFISGSCAVVLWTIRFDRAHDALFPGTFAAPLMQVENLPLFGMFLFLSVLSNSALWMNQFGWDRSGMGTLLLLPIPPSDLVLGKLIGLLRFTLMQVLIGLAPLLWFYRPPLREVLGGLGAAGAAFMLTTGVGHYFSARFPRAVARDGTANVPLYLSWVPAVIMVFLLATLTAIHSLGKGLSTWGAPLFYLLLFGASIAGYLAMLPFLVKQVSKQCERLARM